MLAAIIAFFSSYQSVIMPVINALVGWLLPSPMQKAEKNQKDTHDAENQADSTRGYMDDLDRLP